MLRVAGLGQSRFIPLRSRFLSVLSTVNTPNFDENHHHHQQEQQQESVVPSSQLTVGSNTGCTQTSSTLSVLNKSGDLALLNSHRGSLVLPNVNVIHVRSYAKKPTKKEEKEKEKNKKAAPSKKKKKDEEEEEEDSSDDDSSSDDEDSSSDEEEEEGGKFDVKQMEQQMKESIEEYKKQMNLVRIGRANPALIENLIIPLTKEQKVPLNQIAQIIVKDLTHLNVIPHDPNHLQAIEKGIRGSKLDLNPQVEQNILRVPIPKSTKALRADMVKKVKETTDDFKNKIKNARQEGMKKLKDDELPKDDHRRVEKEIQKVTDKYNEELDKLFEAKKKELSD